MAKLSFIQLIDELFFESSEVRALFYSELSGLIIDFVQTSLCYPHDAMLQCFFAVPIFIEVQNYAFVTCYLVYLD